MNIFQNVQFIGSGETITRSRPHSNTQSLYENCINEYGSNLILENGSIVRNVQFLLTPELIEECSHDAALVRQAVLVEGAKFDLLLKNYMQEGQDYYGLKKDLKEIIAANDMSDEKLRSKGKGLMHNCKRVLQIILDVGVIVNSTAGAITVVDTTAKVAKISSIFGISGLATPVFLSGLLGIITVLICNRILRFTIDTVEFARIKKDAEDIVHDLRKAAKDNPKMAKKYNSSADRLEASIEKYSRKKK